MEAKDMVMNPKEITKVVGRFYSGGSSGLERVAIAQAEISFRAGMKESADQYEEWIQTKLKDWGIKNV